MPTLTVAGHDVTVGDDFLKLSPEDQQSMVNHIAQHLPAEKSDEPSGIVAGFQHGAADLARGDASTIGLTGATTPTLDAAAAISDPKNYKGASLIREGGHWYNPADYQPSAIPQILAEQAPGLTQDASAGYLAGKAGALKGPRAAAIAAMGGFAGSALLRTFGPGAHANADARTGTPNSPVETQDLTREVGKQAVELPLNMVGGGRILNGGKLAGTALEKYLKTVGIEAGTGAANDIVDQAATTAGSKDGLNVDLNRTATSALTRAAGSSVLVAPRLASETAANAKYGKIEADPDQQLAAQALAKRQLLIADGRNLVGQLGGTKVAAEAVNGAHTDVHSELADATKGEDLSQDNTNTLSRINSGDKVNPSAVTALASEASPETMHLARQAMLSRELRASGNISDNSFTGGLGGAMENLPIIRTPIKAAVTTGGAALAGALGVPGVAHAVGAVALPAAAAATGTYALARLADRLTGSRSPAQSFQDRFGGTDAPVRLDATTAPVPEPATTSVPQVTPPQDTALWGTPADKQPNLRATLNSNVKLEEGMAKIAKQLGDQKKKSMIADAIPALQQLAASRQPVTTDEPAQAPAISPTALMMLKQKLKQGLPPEPVVAPPPAPAPIAPPAPPVISPIAQKMLQQKLKQGLPAETPVLPAPVAAPASPAVMPSFNPTALSMLKGKLKAGLPPEPAAPAAAPVGEVSNAPASPAISALMQKLQGQSAPTANAAPVTSEPSAAPQPPLIAKITKKMGKPVEAQQAPEAEQPYTPIPEEALWRKQIKPTANKTQDQLVAARELDSYGPKVVEKYSKNVIANREAKRDFAEGIANDHTPADASIAADLYHQLDHISRRTVARKAIKHYASHMSAAAAHAVNSHFTDKVLQGMWRSE